MIISNLSYTEIGNKKDYTYCCESKFHAIQGSSELCLSLYRAYEYIQAVVILTGLNSALCCKSRASYTEIGNKKDYTYCCDSEVSRYTPIIRQMILLLGILHIYKTVQGV